jgi:cell division septum initiation protein DivIVA
MERFEAVKKSLANALKKNSDLKKEVTDLKMEVARLIHRNNQQQELILKQVNELSSYRLREEAHHNSLSHAWRRRQVGKD